MSTRISAVPAAFLWLACAGGGSADVEPTGWTACTEPRPEVCTMHYDPVCGHRCEAPPCSAADRQTYSNGCAACSDSAVLGWLPGACEED